MVSIVTAEADLYCCALGNRSWKYKSIVVVCVFAQQVYRPGALAVAWGNVPNNRWNFIFEELVIGSWLFVIGYLLLVIWKNSYPCLRDLRVVLLVIGKK